MSAPIRIGIIGMGGYAGLHHKAVLDMERMGLARQVCACDPRPENFAGRMAEWDYAGRGVRVFTDYRKMLGACARGLDEVVVCTPIPLHAEMHRACVEAGVACYLEKPPTLDPAEFETMLAVERGARRSTFVGFNDIIEPLRARLKQRLLDGGFGRIKRAGAWALWGRPVDYFGRASWTGRLFADGHMVLDSCFGNALAHFVHNMLFWVGKGSFFSWGGPGVTQAELYRVNAIEGADTFFVETLAGGVPVRFAFSHAGPRGNRHCERIECEKAALDYVVGEGCRIKWAGGREEFMAQPALEPPLSNHLDYCRYMRGGQARPATTLEDARPFVTLNALAYLSCENIIRIPEKMLAPVTDNDGHLFVTLRDWKVLKREFLERGIWPSGRISGGNLARRQVTAECLAGIRNHVRHMAASGNAPPA
ncbi:MAG: Gfo/Idh/MocA family oxidoreductase [Opitutaceae bacterium]|jgi:predicted dehydrogenase|nr:Gfo/Idh/MocA family oxidoreductase [Opitutaceae bacterium]